MWLKFNFSTANHLQGCSSLKKGGAFKGKYKQPPLPSPKGA